MLIVSIALFVQLGRFAAPLVSQWDESIETYLHKELGLQFSLGSLQARWQGLSPELWVSDIVLWSEGQQQALSIGSASIEVQLLESLKTRSLRLGRLQAENVQINLEQLEDGRVVLLGFPPAAQKTQLSFQPVEWARALRRVDIADVSVQIELAGGSARGLTLSELQLRSDGLFHRLTAGLDLPDRPNTLRFVYEGEGRGERAAYWGKGYLQLSEYPLVHPLAFASGDWVNAEGVRQGYASSQVWFELSDEKIDHLSGEFVYRNEGAGEQIPEAIEAQFSGFWHSSTDWSVGVNGLRGDWKNSPSLVSNLEFGPSRDSVSIRADQLDLSYWTQHLLQFAVLPEKAETVLSTLQPQGLLKNLQLTLPTKSQGGGVSLQAELVGVGVSPWTAVPGFKNVNGYVDAGLSGGRIQVNTAEAFELHFPRLFHVPFQGDHARGEVAWAIDKASNQVLVNSGLLSLSSEYGDVSGYFYLDAPYFARSRKNEVFLQLGVQNAELRARGELIPWVVPGSIRRWVNRALLGGRVPAAGVAIYGLFGPVEEGVNSGPRSVQVAASFADTQLQFLQDWPEVSRGDGRLYLDDNRLTTWVSGAKYLRTTELNRALVTLHKPDDADEFVLGVDADFVGDSEDVLTVLTDTPVRQWIGESFDDWQLRGDSRGSLRLAIPLSGDRTEQQHNIALSLLENTLTLSSQNLSLNNLSGKIQFDSHKGLESNGLTATLWDGPFQATVQSSHYDDEQPWQTRVMLQGQVDTNDVAYWLSSPELLFLQGETDVKGQVLISSAGTRLQLTSNLKGVEIALPQPFGKGRDELSALDIEVPIAYGEATVDINYADKFFSHFYFAKNAAPTATLSLMENLPRKQEGFWLLGRVPELDGPLWLEVFEKHQDYSQGFAALQEQSGVMPLSSAESESGQAFPPLQLDTHLERLTWEDYTFENIDVGGGQVSEGWRISWRNEVATGTASFLDSLPIPLVELEWLRWQTEESEPGEENLASEQDPLIDVDPRSLPEVNLVVSDLQVDDRKLGAWSLRMQPLEHGLLIDQVIGKIGDTVISGQADESGGARVSWLTNGSSFTTQVEGRVSGGNLAAVTDALTLPRVVESKSTQLGAEIQWPGSPLFFSATEFSGDVHLDLREGRFLQEANQTGDAFLRLVGLFNFDNWARRLKLDFSDVYKGGTAFDSIRGDLQFDQGMLHLDEPLVMKNASSRMLLGGSIDLRRETLDATLVATLPVGGNATLLTALIAGLPAAAGVYVASKVFEKQMDRAASFSYQLTGPWANPKVEFDKMFDNKAADKASEKSRARSNAVDSEVSVESDTLNQTP